MTRKIGSRVHEIADGLRRFSVFHRWKLQKFVGFMDN